jgi:hypothetical protein
MVSRREWRQFINKPIIEWILLSLGVALLIVSPLVGAIPGPGGIIVAGIGLALVLKASMWAKRRYVRFKRWQPKAGRWTDLALRRQSAKRRDALRRAAESGSGN